MNDADATKRFYDELWPHRATVLRAARYFCRSDSDADDLAQETFLKAFSSIDRFAAGSNAKAWLMTILRHAHIDRLRLRESSEVSVDAMDTEVADERPHEESEWQNPEQAMEVFSDSEMITALKSLPRDICWTLLLVDVEQMNDDDAAAVLNVPKGTVKSRLHRGRRMLRAALLPLARDRRMVS